MDAQQKQTVWLIDADNQSPQIAPRLAKMCGAPHKVILAGRPKALMSWRNAQLPTGIEREELVAPDLPDAADLLLAMTAGRSWQDWAKAYIVSGDKMITQTLGGILSNLDVDIVAAASVPMDLPYPSITLPTRKAQIFTFCPPAPTIPAAEADAMMDIAFEELGNPDFLWKAQVGAWLQSKGRDKTWRQALLSSLERYEVVDQKLMRGRSTAAAPLRRASRSPPAKTHHATRRPP
jgi:hypothetical protein